VLLQEVSRFNVLLQTIRTSLASLRRAIEGEVIMSQELDYMFDSLLNNQVPRVWAKAAYPSLKPLRSWIRDLKDRVAFMGDWLYKGAPFCFWLSGFFFPQGFLTGSLQSHARQPGKEIPIDELVWTFKFLEVEKEGCAARPAEGALLYGLFLEGAGFDRKKKALVDSASNQMYVAMPVIHFIPFRTVKDDGSPNFPELKSEVYNCPVYKTTERAGLLSTTGQSTNFVLAVDVPAGEQAPDFWVLRGTALFCQLS
jgi:dynein heavy chain, axonemal